MKEIGCQESDSEKAEHAEHAGKALKPGVVPQHILDEIRAEMEAEYGVEGPVPEPERTAKRALDERQPIKAPAFSTQSSRTRRQAVIESKGKGRKSF